MIQLSVVVITFNESENIERCLHSVAGIADEMLVVDSFSTDDTVARAQALGAKVMLHPFESYNQQRSFAAQQASHDYVLALDADEYLSNTLHEAILKIKKYWKSDTYTFNRLNKIGDTWLRHTSWYPDTKLRLFDRRKVIFTGIGGHDTIKPVPGATTQHLPGELLHHASADLHSRAQQTNNLSTASARYLFEQGKRTNWLRILLKPLARFLVEYILKRGYLAGFYGFMLSKTSAYYVFLREAKLAEMWRLRSDQHQ